MDILKKTFQEIKSLKIQGATAVARHTIIALGQYGKKLDKKSLGQWRRALKKGADYLLSARPTEPMAQNGVKFILSQLGERQPVNINQARNSLIKAADDFLLLMYDAKDLIISRGWDLVRNNDNIFTHCHSFLVETLLVEAHQRGRKFEVFNTETRPLYQGRITARNLLKQGIPVTMVADSSAAFLISHYSGEELMMNKIILGADALLPDGAAINKIGSFGIGAVAQQENIPLYIVAPLLKFHPRSWIKIEKRSPKEIWPKAPKKLEIINFAFDQIPSQYIKGIICEKGIITPQEVVPAVKKFYPWIVSI